MKLTYKQVAGFLKAPLNNCVGVLLYGPDSGLVLEHAKTVRNSAVSDPKDPFSTAELTDSIIETNPAALADELFAFNMLGGKRLVSLRTEEESIPKIIEEIYMGDSLPEAYFLVTAGELGPRSSLRAFFEKHPKLAALPCYRDESIQIDGLIMTAFKSANIKANREVVDYLADHLGNDRGITRQELQKILLYVGDTGALSLEEAEALIGNFAERTMDDFCTALADGLAADTDAVMQKILQENVQPVVVLRSINRYFQKLHNLHAQMQAGGVSIDQVIENLKPKVFYKQLPILKRHVLTWKPVRIEKALAIVLKAEQATKESGNVAEIQLQQAILALLSLASVAKRSAA